MSESKHTPGPWEIDKSFGVPGGSVPVMGPDGYNVAMVNRSEKGARRNAEGHANASLIAAAPELLEALKMAEQVLVIARGITKEDYNIYDRIIAQGHAYEMKSIRAAIAKAEGNS